VLRKLLKLKEKDDESKRLGEQGHWNEDGYWVWASNLKAQKERGMENIEVELWGQEDLPYTAMFVGRWLLWPDESETRTGEPGYDAGAYYGVALTRRANIAVYVRHVNDGFAPALTTYGSFEEAEQEGVPADILAMAAAPISDGYVQKLDI